MPPRTRSSISSLPATPSARSFTSTSTSPRTTPRKVPHCSKCGKPRAGHPRSGCPFDLSNSPKQESPDLTNALSDLHIETLASHVDNKAAIRGRRVAMPEASLASLSSTSSDVVNRLLKPGIMSNDTDEEDEDTVKRWQETIATPSKPPGGRPARNYMPCTLNTPTPSFFDSQDVIPEDVKACSQETSSSVPSALSRTMSTQERITFLSDLAMLSAAPPVTLLRFNEADIDVIDQAALKLGFYTRIVKGNPGDLWTFILGRNAAAVEGAFQEVTRDEDNAGEERRSGGRQGAAFARGAVVGAVATFTGLAFS